MNLYNKTLIVTGVASGIGAEVARLARFQGATVIGVDRHEPQLTLEGFFQADLSDPASIDALVARLPARVDGLCNIAGVPGTAPLQAVATVNYLGLRHLTQSLLPRMPAGGSIVNVASILGAQWPQRLELHKALAATQSFEAGQQWRKSGRAGHLLSVLQGSADRLDPAASPGLLSRSCGAHQLRRARAGVHPHPGRFRQHARPGSGGPGQPTHDPSGSGR